MNNESVCKLCGGGPVCASHILPNFAYKEATNQNGHPKMIVVRSARKGSEVDKSRQSGFTEPILCKSCEAKFSKWETYASNKLWNFSHPPAQQIPSGEKLISLTGIDYKKLKLFELSILWRASVSQNDFFKWIQLGPHEEKIRQMLLNDNPGKPDDYGCAVFKLENDALLDFRHLVFQPMALRLGFQHFSLFSFRGYVFMFLVSKPQRNDSFKSVFPSEQGELMIFERNVRGFPVLCDLLNKGIKASREWED